MLNDPRDKWSFLTHFFGALLASVGTVYLIISKTERVLPFLIFGISMVALYSCSALYHYIKGPEELILKLRKLDHSMIFVLIAGTYTPILVNIIPKPTSTVFLMIIWGVTAAGIIMKQVWLNAPRWLYTFLYVLMGWALVAKIPFIYSVSEGCAVWLIIGGVLYTAGALMYAMKKPNLIKNFGFHEIFHVFIILGTLCHFTAIAFYV
ncbi:MAG TPA: hemolysin III family protein [Bacillota bacterium]|nr:hemolysin III family protein [Bacillota bacterium]